ncbi:MAG: HlyD family type I secretion periplasmic adaptor subunit [Rhizobiaceae bacterium]
MKTDEMIALAARQAVFNAATGGSEMGTTDAPVMERREVTPEQLKANTAAQVAAKKVRTDVSPPAKFEEKPVTAPNSAPVTTPALAPAPTTLAAAQEAASAVEKPVPVDRTNWQDEVPLDNKKVVKKGLLFVFGFLGLFLLWAILFPISSAVVSAGKMVSAGANKLIQHPAGGVVRQILVREGEQVEKNQVVVVLDPSVSQAELSRLTARHTLLNALQTRLNSEQGENGFSAVENSSGLQLRGAQDSETQSISAGAKRILEEQRKEYNAGRKRLNAQLDAATSLVESLKDQRLGLQARLAGAQQLLNYSEMELQKIRPLVRDGYLPKARLWDVDKKRLEQVTSVGNFEAEIDATSQRVSEAEAQISQLTEADQEQRSEELTKVMGELAEIRDQIKAARTAVDSTELRAPVAGTLTKMTANTMGGVIVPGAVVAEVVPKNSGLVTEFRVALEKIQAVKVGQKARVVITAFNRRTYDPIEAEVIYVSADQEVDPMTGDTYFLARARLNDNTEKNNGLAEIQAGMQTEVFALAEPRVFMSYLMQPIYDSFSKAFRETN